jgi:hypothetical protein
VNLRPFEDEAVRALYPWKFPPAAEGLASRRVACVTLIFRLRNSLESGKRKGV